MNKTVCFETESGTYYLNSDDRFHNTDGPAIISDGYAEYWVDGKLHRLDGPAVIYEDGKTRWFINGDELTEEITHWAKDMNIDLDNLTDEDKVLLVMKFHDYPNEK